MIVSQTQMLQRYVRVRRSHRECACRCARVAVLAHQRQRSGSILRDSRRERDADEGAGREPHPLAHAGDGIEHRPRRARERAAVERHRRGQRSSSPQELHAIGFPFDCAAKPAVDGEHVERPRGRLLGRSRTSAEQKPRTLGVVRRLDEELGLLTDLLQGGLTVGRCIDTESGVLQVPADHFAHNRLVVDDKHTGRAGG